MRASLRAILMILTVSGIGLAGTVGAQILGRWVAGLFGLSPMPFSRGPRDWGIGISLLALVFGGGWLGTKANWTENVVRWLERRLHRPKPVPLDLLTREAKQGEPERARKFL